MRKSETVARELVLNILYQVDGCNIDFTDALNTTLENADMSSLKTQQKIDDAKSYARELAVGIKAHQDIDDIIIKYSAEDWPFYRLAVVDKNILRIAIYEIEHSDRAGSVVAIDEAVKLAQKFSTDKACGFINGLLAAFARDFDKTKKEK